MIKNEFDQNNFCKKEFCQIKFDEKEILIVKKRLNKDFICNFDGNMVINLNKKYLLPKCANLDMIDATDDEVFAKIRALKDAY